MSKQNRGLCSVTPRVPSIKEVNETVEEVTVVATLGHHESASSVVSRSPGSAFTKIKPSEKYNKFTKTI